MPKLKRIDNSTLIYARPDGWHYHLDRNCKMSQGGDFERLGYTTIRKTEIKKKHLRACSCAYQDYKPPNLITDGLFESAIALKNRIAKIKGQNET